LAKHGTGWLPDIPDFRDWRYEAPREVVTNLPPAVDLRAHDAPIFDQGELGSCTANAIAGALVFDEIRQHRRPTMRSRLQLYFAERELEGTIDSDAGAMIRDGIKVCAKQGVCPESSWPYVIERFARRPPARCFKAAEAFHALTYRRVSQTNADLKSAIASGFNVVFGFTVYESFESDAVARTGEVPMPGRNEGVVGGHAVRAVGYDEVGLIPANSWSAAWGQHGYFRIPWAYVLDNDLDDDFWMISTVGRP